MDRKTFLGGIGGVGLIALASGLSACRHAAAPFLNHKEKPAMIKMVVINFRKPGMTLEEFTAYWKKTHADLVRQHGRKMGIRKYVQSHVLPSPDMDAFAKARGWAAAPDGLTEVWFDSLEAMQKAMGSPEGQAASAILAADEPNLINPSRISAFLSTEYVVYDDT